MRVNLVLVSVVILFCVRFWRYISPAKIMQCFNATALVLAHCSFFTTFGNSGWITWRLFILTFDWCSECRIWAYSEVYASFNLGFWAAFKGAHPKKELSGLSPSGLLSSQNFEQGSGSLYCSFVVVVWSVLLLWWWVFDVRQWRLMFACEHWH